MMDNLVLGLMVLMLSFKKLAMSSGDMSNVVMLGDLATPVLVMVALPLSWFWSACFLQQSLVQCPILVQ